MNKLDMECECYCVRTMDPLNFELTGPVVPSSPWLPAPHCVSPGWLVKACPVLLAAAPGLSVVSCFSSLRNWWQEYCPRVHSESYPRSAIRRRNNNFFSASTGVQITI